MRQITLTESQNDTLEARHKKSSGKRECDRIKAILLRDEGWPTPMIAQALRIHEIPLFDILMTILAMKKSLSIVAALKVTLPKNKLKSWLSIYVK